MVKKVKGNNMVIIHVANIDPSIIGGVQMAVPKMIEEQSKYAEVAMININRKKLININMLEFDNQFEIIQFKEPFNRPDLIVFHEIYRFDYIHMYKKIVQAKIPYVIIPHGSLTQTAQKKKFIKKLVANLMYFNGFIKHSSVIQYLSSNEQQTSIFKRHPSLVLGNGVMAPRRIKTSFSKGTINFTYIGRLDIKIKGLDLLILAFKYSQELLRKTNAKLNLYGPDYNNSHRKLQAIIDKLEISDIVKVHKEVLGIEKEEILLKTDCFIQTSRSEGMPLGPLEALSYGVPCIVTDGVGLGNDIAFANAGFKCATNVIDIIKALNQFINDYGNIEVMSHCARILIQNKYDLRMIAKKSIDSYRELINK